MDPIDWTPFHVISINKKEGKPTKYVLNYDGLKKQLESIKEIPVAIIPIVGPSRMGKSFIMNYMIRYLSDPKNLQWIGDNEDQLRGFEWKSDTEPQTSGLWLSKPFIVEKSNGNEIGVILMDTQGVFDEYNSQRDWSTIVGISLLMSSSIIFNLFTNLQEDCLMSLESFLEYGLKAAKANPLSEEKPFQNLVFLIRDWNTPQKFKYGSSGGNEFLETKLISKIGQSSSARLVRDSLKKCFSEVTCFLMPKIGEKAEEEEFNGSVNGLHLKFVDKMKEFIEKLLNPEDIKHKIIDNNSINGEDLVEYFKTYVDIFNSDELPNPTDMIEATAKTADIIHLNKLKDSNMTQLKTFIQSQPFIARKGLLKHIKDFTNEMINNFDGLKKSSNKDIIKELYEMRDNYLKSNVEQIWDLNERNREVFITKMADKCRAEFEEAINGVLDSTFLDSDILEENLNKNRKQIEKTLRQHFGDEEEDLFSKELLKFSKELDNIEKSFKTENKQRRVKAEHLNSEAVNQALESYKNGMKSVLEDNVYLSKDEFKSLEKEVDSDAKKLFKQKCTSGDSKFRSTYESEFSAKLKELKDEFKQQNTHQCERVISNTENQMKDSFKDFSQRMNGVFELIDSLDSLVENYEELKQKHLILFKEGCLYKDSDFLSKYLNELENNFNESLIEWKTKFSEREERIRNQLRAKINESKDLYSKEMEDTINDDNFLSDEELQELHESSKEKSFLFLENYCESELNNFEISTYSEELKEMIDREYERYVKQNQKTRELKQRDFKDVVNEFLEKYEKQMEKCVDLANSQSELEESHKQIKNQTITEFMDQNQTQDITSIETHRQNLEEKIDESFEDMLELLQLRLKSQESVAKTLKNDIRKYYREEMDKYYQKTSFLSKNKLINNHESVVNRIASKFESERGVMSSDSYLKLIEVCIKDIYAKIEADNDMNTPTIAAIGIDLGTTNSCVAYYKPGPKNQSSVVVIENELGSKVTPSVVAFKDDGKVVGSVAKEESHRNPKQTIYSAKRLIGRLFSDQSVQSDIKNLDYDVVDDGLNNTKITVQVKGVEEVYFPEQISAEVLKKMKEIAENYLGLKITKAVITVPAYFNDTQKEATKDAGKLAGLEVLKIINEPTAAAVAFQLNKSDDYSSRKVLIYDFGGGTFDVAVLNIEKGEINVMAVGGDNHLGGDDIDNNLVDHCLDEFRIQTGLNVSKKDPTAAVPRLRRLCEVNKCQLSSADSTTITIDSFYKMEELRVDLSRDKFEELNEQLFIKSMDLVAQTLQDAGLGHDAIDDIVLVGGTTRIPRIQEMLSDQFGGRPLNHQVNPDEAVAVGAAIQAAILNGQQAQGLGHLKVSDVAPMSLGVKIKGGLMSVIIPRNSKVPNVYESHYTTSSDYQTSVDVEVFEGEEEKADNNRHLGKFELNGIPAGPAGEQNIKVLFEITDEGILRVTAKISSTGGEKEIEIKEHKGRLTDQELEQMILQGN